MKRSFFIVAILLILTASFLYVNKKSRRCVKPVSNRIPTELNFSKILGTNREEMARLIESFPLDSYQVYYLPKHKKSYFYLDGIGCDRIKTHLSDNKPWEKHLQKLIKKYALPGSTVIDVGAHIGTLTLVMAKAVGPQGQVIAFEPQPKMFRELFLNMAINSLNNISFYWGGLGERNQLIELTPLQSGNEGGTGLLLSPGVGSFVPLMTLDSLSLSNVSLIKIDVESMENQVLEGARETISKNRPVILIEIQGGTNIRTAPNQIRKKILETIDKLEELGYSATHLQEHDWIAFPNPEI